MIKQMLSPMNNECVEKDNTATLLHLKEERVILLHRDNNIQGDIRATLSQLK